MADPERLIEALKALASKWRAEAKDVHRSPSACAAAEECAAELLALIDP
jgi:hypothetical protein